MQHPRAHLSQSVRRVWTACVLWAFLEGYSAVVYGTSLLDLSETHQFDISAQPLATALLQFSNQAHIQLATSGAEVGKARTSGVHGTMPMGAALSKLLAGTGFEYRVSGERSVAVLLRNRQVKSNQPELERASASSRIVLTAPGAASDAPMEEVMVTTRKRSESLLEVPSSITSLTEKTLEQFNLQTFTDYAAMVPNLAFDWGMGGARGFSDSRGVIIRGVEGLNTTGFYIDDMAIPASQDPRIVDVQRVEVLKGPQGTLFGAGSMGGNIRIITNEPSFESDELKLMSQVGNSSSGGNADYGASLIKNVALLETLAVRAVGYVNHDAGYVTRRFPADDEAGTELASRGEGEDFQYGGSLAARFRPNERLEFNLKLLGQSDQHPHGWPAVYPSLPSFELDTLTISRADPRQDSNVNGWIAPGFTVTYAGAGWELTSASSYFEQSASDVEDTTEAMFEILPQFLPADFNYVDSGYDTKIVNNTHIAQEELRLGLNPWHGLSGIIGGYYKHETDESRVLPRDVTGAGTALDYPSDIYFAEAGMNTLQDASLFAEFYIKPSDLLTLTLGARRYGLEQSSAQRSLGFVTGQKVPTSFDFSNSEHGISPKFAVQLEPRADTLVYATVAKGFRPGGAQPPTTLASCAQDIAALGLTPTETATYKSDDLWSYEVGAKQSIDEGRVLLTAAAFQIDWSKIQQTVALQCGVSFLANAGAARIRGSELELAAPLNSGLQMRMGLGYTDGVITNSDGNTGQAVGTPIFDVPKLTASSALAYSHPLSARLSGFGTLDASYSGSSYSNNSSSLHPLRRAGYQILNTRIGARWDNTETSIYINNITDTKANYGVLVAQGLDRTVLIDGQSVNYPRLVVSSPLQVGIQFRHGF